jgi:hypothetical protein
MRTPARRETPARTARRDGERWRAYWIDDGPEEKLLFYCPECFEREFGRC